MEKTENKTKKTRLKGVVVSDKMKDTVVVSVSRYVKHTKYKKYMKIDKLYKASDIGNTLSVGDTVFIEECAPLSKDKRFKVVAK